MAYMQIPLTNEFKFTEEGLELLPQYNYPQFDREANYYQLLPFQKKKFYKNRKQQNDKNCVQINTNLGGIEIEIRESITGVLLDTIAPTTTASIPGMEYNGVALDTYQWVFKLSDILPSFTGTCYYRITGTVPGTGEEKAYISEPIWVKEKWPNTVLVEWGHDRNDYDTIFSLNPQFSIRIDGYYLLDETDSLDTQFEDQFNATVTLNTYVKRKFKLELGFYNGIPRYMLDRLMNFFACKFIKVEGWKYSKSEGAKLEVDKSDTATVFNASIILEETNPTDSYTFSTSTVITLLPASGFPYAVLIMGINKNGDTVYFVQPPNPIIIENLANAQSFVDTWNTQTLSLGLNGYITIENGNIVYKGDYYEDYTPVSTGLYKHFTESVRFLAASAVANRTISNSGEILADFNGTYQVISPGVLQPISYNFGNGGIGSSNIRYFHNDEIEYYATLASGNARPLNYDGVMSSTLQQFILTAIHPDTLQLNLELLQYCNLTLSGLECTASGVTSFLDPFAAGAANPDNFRLLADININGNSITQVGLRNFVVNFRNNCNYAYQAVILSKTLTIGTQTPPVSPDIPTQNAIIDLQNAGWTVV